MLRVIELSPFVLTVSSHRSNLIFTDKRTLNGVSATTHKHVARKKMGSTVGAERPIRVLCCGSIESSECRTESGNNDCPFRVLLSKVGRAIL